MKEKSIDERKKKKARLSSHTASQLVVCMAWVLAIWYIHTHTHTIEKQSLCVAVVVMWCLCMYVQVQQNPVWMLMALE